MSRNLSFLKTLDGQDREKLQKFEYLGNERGILVEIKVILQIFLRTFSW